MKKTCSSNIYQVTIDCSDVGDCVNAQLAKIIADQTTDLVDFCRAVSTCVDEQLGLIADGDSNYLGNFGTATNKVLESLAGFSGSGDLYLTAVDGDIQWTEVVAGTTFVEAGEGVTVSGDGTFGNPYVVDALTTSYSDELAQDAVGGILSNEFIYADVTPTISIGTIGLSKISTSFLSLLYGNGTDVQEAIVTTPILFTGGSLSLDTIPTVLGGTGLTTIGTALQYLRVNGTATGLEYDTPLFLSGNENITFSGDVTGSGATSVTLSIANDAVLNEHLRDSVGYSVIGRYYTGTGDPADIIAGDDSVLRRSGSGDLAFGTLVTNNIGNSQITYAKIQDTSASDVILGRYSSGAGVVQELTVAGGSLDINNSGILELESDETSPGASQFYGTTDGGVKGWQPLNRTLIGVTRFTTSGTWTKPVGCNAVVVEVQGAGGGGGAALANVAEVAAGGGGGAGAHYRAFITSGLGATVAVTVGTGGAGSSNTASLGSSGNPSSFGSFGSAGGGTGGAGMTTGTAVTLACGGQGGSTSALSGSTVMSGRGNSGTIGLRVSGSSFATGQGGGSLYAGSTHSCIVGTGSDGLAYGAGGGGASQNGVAATNTGGNGSNGIVIVYEYS